MLCYENGLKNSEYTASSYSAQQLNNNMPGDVKRITGGNESIVPGTK